MTKAEILLALDELMLSDTNEVYFVSKDLELFYEPTAIEGGFIVVEPVENTK